MTARTAVALSLLAGLALPASGCFLFPELVQTPRFEGDDVRMETPTRFRTLGETGEVTELADEVATDVNRWVADTAMSFGDMLDELNQHPPTREDGEWRIYGPENDEDGENASWMARVSGDEDEAHFEVLVGERDAKAGDMTVLFSGDVAVEGAKRSGGFSIDFDVWSKLDALAEDFDEGDEIGGTISVDFSREGALGKTVDITFDEFWYVSPSNDEDFDYQSETYAYHRDATGEGVFHFATWAAWEEEGLSGPERERVTVDMAWDANGAGRARAQVLEVEGQGDLEHGDLIVSECFDNGAALTWAEINEAYAAHNPEFNEGDEAKCTMDESVLDRFED